jgi:hypothetical protein
MICGELAGVAAACRPAGDPGDIAAHHARYWLIIFIWSF